MWRTLIVVLAVGLVAVPAAEAKAPRRTEAQAEKRVERLVYTGTYACYGRHGDGSELYRSFNCVVDDWEADSSHLYRLTARRGGRWRVREL